MFNPCRKKYEIKIKQYAYSLKSGFSVTREKKMKKLIVLLIILCITELSFAQVVGGICFDNPLGWQAIEQPNGPIIFNGGSDPCAELFGGAGTYFVDAMTSWQVFPDAGYEAIPIFGFGSGQFEIIATLPVEFSAFTAQFIENTPTLYWETQSETDNMGWFVYRSEENDFTSSDKISEFIEGHGTTTQPQSYLYEDRIQNPEVGSIYYYWLESIDYSGIINHYDKVAILTIPDAHGSSGNLVPIPERFGLLQNEPNPVVNSTRIAFNLPETAQVDLNIYNLKGQLVKTLYSGVTSKHTIMWDGKDNDGNVVENGVYFYKMTLNGNTKETKKLILMK